MTEIVNETFDQERALYGADGLSVSHCRFDGPADGESAFKEGKHIYVDNCFFNLRYPFWHDDDVRISHSEMTGLCRAALWYSHGIHMTEVKLHGIKALRECGNVQMEDCDVISPEFGWSSHGVKMDRCTVESEYFMLRASDLRFDNVTLKGKYSFQYVENGVLKDCNFDTKDAFWHSKNLTVKNSVIKGEYLAWYSENLTLDHCKIMGTQPLCYCKGLRLIDCEMIDTDLAFERSEVEATILTPIDSIKNPYAGLISVPSVGEVILDDEHARAEIKAG